MDQGCAVEMGLDGRVSKVVRDAEASNSGGRTGVFGQAEKPWPCRFVRPDGTNPVRCGAPQMSTAMMVDGR